MRIMTSRVGVRRHRDDARAPSINKKQHAPHALHKSTSAPVDDSSSTHPLRHIGVSCARASTHITARVSLETRNAATHPSPNARTQSLRSRRARARTSRKHAGFSHREGGMVVRARRRGGAAAISSTDERA